MHAGESLAGALANLAGAISESGAKIESEPLLSLSVHAIHLQQLFQNLVGNAIKYRRPNVSASVHVAAQRQNGTWLFSVRDNGIEPLHAQIGRAHV